MTTIESIGTLNSFSKEAMLHQPGNAALVSAIGIESGIITVRLSEHLTRDMYRFYTAGAGIFDEGEIVLCQLYINGEMVDTLVRHAIRG